MVSAKDERKIPSPGAKVRLGPTLPDLLLHPRFQISSHFIQKTCQKIWHPLPSRRPSRILSEALRCASDLRELQFLRRNSREDVQMMSSSILASIWRIVFVSEVQENLWKGRHVGKLGNVDLREGLERALLLNFDSAPFSSLFCTWAEIAWTRR